MVTENEDWLIDRGGEIIEKRVQGGISSLNDWERLVYCLWVVDYMLRNAGDFALAEDLYPDFQSDARRLSDQLSLTWTNAAFSLPQCSLQREYFERFEAICDEVRNAEPAGSPPGESEDY